METSEPKKYPPTPKKLRELRKKGQFPKTELAEPTFSIIFFLIVIVFFFISVFSDFNYWVEFVIFTDYKYGYYYIFIFLTIFVALFAIAKIFLIIIYWIVINKCTTSSKRQPLNFNKLNPVEGFKNTLGASAIANSFRKVLELLFLVFLLKYVFDTYGIELNKLHKVSNPSYFLYDLLYYTTAIAILMIVYGICIGSVDYFFESYRFKKKNRMTMTEMKNEMKETEGSPLIKAERRRKMYELFHEPMTNGRQPTFALANPTHILIPICYEKEIDAAPIILDIYTDEMVIERKNYYISQGIPIIEDKPLTRKIYQKTKRVGTLIDPEFYNDVALIIVALKRRRDINE